MEEEQQQEEEKEEETIVEEEEDDDDLASILGETVHVTPRSRRRSKRSMSRRSSGVLEVEKSPLQFARKNPFAKINEDFKLERSEKVRLKEGVKEERMKDVMRSIEVAKATVDLGNLKAPVGRRQPKSPPKKYEPPKRYSPPKGGTANMSPGLRKRERYSPTKKVNSPFEDLIGGQD